MNKVVRPTMNKLSTMLFQVVTVEQWLQCWNNLSVFSRVAGLGKIGGKIGASAPSNAYSQVISLNTSDFVFAA